VTRSASRNAREGKGGLRGRLKGGFICLELEVEARFLAKGGGFDAVGREWRGVDGREGELARMR